jgi:alpha-galactosidase
MVNPDSDLYRTHPDWTYHFPTREASLSRKQLVLNIARPEVKKYIIDFLTLLLGTNNIRYLKWDCNRAFSEPGWPDRPYAKQREMWVRHVTSLYEILSA